MPKGDVGIFLIDAIVQAARSLRPGPLAVVCGASQSHRPSGVDAIIPCPAAVDDARHLTDLCIRATLPRRVLIVDDFSTMQSVVEKIL